MYRPLHIPLDLVPVRPPLGKLIHLLGPEDAAEAVPIRNNDGHVLGVPRVDEVDLAQLAQGLEVGQQVRVPEGLDVIEVEIAVGDELGSALGGDALALDVLADGGEEAQADLGVEHLEHGLLGAADQHGRVRADEVHHPPRRLRRPQVRHVRRLLPLAAAEGGEAGHAGPLLRRRADVLDLVHQHVDALVQPRRHALVQHLLELLLGHARLVQEVVAVRDPRPRQLLLVEHVDHLRDQVAHIDQLDERDQRRDAALAAVVCHLPGLVTREVVYGLLETGFDMSVSEDAQETDEYLCALLPRFFAGLSAELDEDCGAAEAGLGHVD
ncbi:hypothetical protein VP1G_10881 [Cytospora mali]|uniref:Uncharacterized protein n=1 Tax=Cytospora mali TaxID=578113 RepID=A0A194UYQ3_CYTMA|nr:hypothetical protein VP1G_10881 [Valsa mali var. pyri (nom. inval.)]